MANRYHDRSFSADHAYDRSDDPHAPAPRESDPLAELARLIGQTDPFNGMGRANHQVQPRGEAHDRYHQPEPETDEGIAAGPPPWMQRAVRHEAPQHEPQPYEEEPEQDPPSAVHPLHRYAQQHAEPEPDYDHEPAYEHAEEPLGSSRYDDALYGQVDSGLQETQYEQAYSDDPYTYQDSDEAEDQPVKRRGGLSMVAAVLALAVVGTGAAFAYRTYVGSPRSGEPPIIKADTSPTKIIPTPADGSAKLPDRLASGDGTEKIVSREEAPVDVNAKASPRMVFPQLSQNASPPTVASVAPNSGLPPAPPTGGTGTLSNNEPRKIKTFSVRGDETETASVPAAAAAQPSGSPAAAKPAPAARTAATTPRTPPAAVSGGSSAPMSLAPQAAPPAAFADPQARIATNAPTPIPSGTNSNGSTGGYLVQVSSQRNEADAQASYKVLQGKFPSVLGSRSPVIKRADLGEKGVYYRAMVGPFGSPEEASQFCGSLKTAGGQCVVQRN
jgi:hypothetical protein